ncbi:LAQU0S25e00320g1_1 [Lachancea quebecensis]|uniref:LAQU0S25e00320g1_1 n=1 Tax=Lachancea quebecensis TaxID=1654605 RepID=A0A0N7MMG3_9SACH|nr:LAQU0S25e00320g1_1 [Lachancea quebecensis]
MPKKRLVSPEQPAFELPSLPPWRTPKIKILHHTPSRGRSLLDESDIFGTPQESDQIKRVEKNPDIYEYSPFCDKKLLANSKITQLLNSETATHCLVFHKDEHKSPKKKYRPDLNMDCCDSSDEEDPQLNRSLLVSVPETLCPPERPNVRRFENNASSERIALRDFWGGSEIPEILDRSQLRDLHTILQQESDLVRRSERQVQSQNQIPHQIEGDTYHWLRKYCNNAWEKDSWMFNG